ncbi:MAG TPA: DUF1269 domain-containing protein [Fimbriimonadaceae bacterium]|nr:DUF1269 domain-containing protein [Fimbriimonadaceae bacterium]
MRSSHSIGLRVGVASVGVVLAASIGIPWTALAQNVVSDTLIYAVYDGEKTASQVFQTIRKNQKATGERIESYAIVSKDVKAKTHVLDQRQRDATVGAILGATIGVLGGPPGVVAGAAVGGGAGYLTGEAVGIPRETIEEMKASLTPGTSALIVVLDNKWVQDVDKALRQASARHVVAAQVATGQTTAPGANPSKPAPKPAAPASQTTPSHS